MTDILSFPDGARILCGEERNLEVPPGANEALIRWGGLNRFGEPNYRFVWGWARRDWKVGKWIDRKPGDEYQIVREVIEARYVPKYFPRERFHLEKWRPPEEYGLRDEWERDTTEVMGARNVAQLGPYPNRGDYEHFRVVETSDGRFVWPNAEIARLYVMLNRLSMQESSADRWARIKAEDAAEEAATKTEVKDQIDDRFPAFGMRPHVAMPGITPFEKAS